MYLCFIDESGHPPKPSATNPRPHFVIAGVIVHEAQWHGIADELRKLKDRPEFKIMGEVKWRFFGPDNADPENPVRHLSREARDQFRRQMYEILTRRKSVKLVACVANAAAAYKQSYVKNAEDLYHYTYKPVSERFQYFLQDISRAVGDQQLGLVVCDHRGKKQDDLLRDRHHKLIDDEQMFSSAYPNYVETIFMTPSHLSVGIQFADMVAGAVGRFYNSGEEQYFEMVRGAFRSSPTGKIDGYGVVKFPGRGW
jgi:hypothetical protein